MNILTKMPLHEDDIKQLEQLGDFHIYTDESLPKDLESKVDIIYGWSPKAAQILHGTNQVKYIQTYSAGVDYLPIKQLVRDKVLVANSSGIHGEVIGESVLGYLLSFGRGIHSAERASYNKQWHHQEIRANLFTLTNKVALIYGTGHIGSAISQMLQRFGVKTVGVHRHSNQVAAFDETIKNENAHTKLSQVDFVINTLPLTKETTHMFNAAFFKQMSTDGIFINVGRGGSVDTDGLYQALEQHQIKGAALDVVEEEPLAIDSKLWELSNLIITPHVSGTVPHLRREMFKIFYPNLKSFLDNQTLTINQVDLENGY